MTTITLKAPAIISAGSKVDAFTQAVETDLDARTTPLSNGQFTVTVAESDVREVKVKARQYGFQVLAEN